MPMMRSVSASTTSFMSMCSLQSVKNGFHLAEGGFVDVNITVLLRHTRASSCSVKPAVPISGVVKMAVGIVA